MKDSYQHTFTVFTPTYNRAHTLSRVYESLSKQTYKNFEWLIVDDGSTDSTKELVDKWRKDDCFVTRYYFQQNQGKHIAFDRAVDLAQGELFLTFDSDDACVPRALERFKYHWDNIPQKAKREFSGVCGLCLDQRGKVVGDRFPHDSTDASSLEMFFKYKIKGEKWGFQRTDVLKHFRFPAVKSVFVPESLVWFAIARHYKQRFVNEALRTYWVADRNDAEHITGRFVAERHAEGRRVYYETMLNEYIDWLPYAPVQFTRMAANYCRMSLHLGKPMRRQIKVLKPLVSKVWSVAAFPIGLLLYLKDRRTA